jgi:hypothetical protein
MNDPHPEYSTKFYQLIHKCMGVQAQMHRAMMKDVPKTRYLWQDTSTNTSPTRVTKNTASLIDVVITDKETISDTAIVIDLGYSDHKAQVLQLPLKKMVKKWKVITSRQYSEKRVEEFKCLLSKESWQELYQTLEVNSGLQIFMENFGYYFNIAFPYKSQKLRNMQKNRWITKGLKNSSRKMHFLNSLKRKFNLSREAQAYIKKYQITYKKVLKEAKKRKMIGLLKRHQIKQKRYGS